SSGLVREVEGDGTAIAVCLEYPLTPQRQVGTIYVGPRPGQGQSPRMLMAQGCSLRLVQGSTRLPSCRPSMRSAQGCRRAIRPAKRVAPAPGRPLDRAAAAPDRECRG